jgi:Anti-sigma factor NepR
MRHSDPRAAVLISMKNPNEPSQEASSNTGAGQEEARLRQQAIGVKLRHMFDEVVNEPVPDEFLDILRRADERSAGGSGA